MNQEAQNKFDQCSHREWKEFEGVVGCCPEKRRVEKIAGWYCPKRQIAQLSPEICLDCWLFEKKSDIL